MAEVASPNKDAKDAGSPNKDKLFDPSVDMLVNDFDDERTLEEEEALAAGEAEDPNAELSNLQKESNMPLEELLALYGYRGENQNNESPIEEEHEQSETMEEQESEPDPPDQPSKLSALYEPLSESDQDAKDAGSPNKDKLFDPSVDMLVNDFDDERTLEEEEALAASEAEDPNAELSNLQKESNMPLEELLALYGYRGENQENESPIDDQDQSETMEEQESEPDPPDQPSKLSALYEPLSESDQDASRLLRSVSRISEEEEEDYDYSPDEDEWRKVNKTIMVGNDYQAQIPEGLCHYDDALPYENEDKLLWDPYLMDQETIELFLKKASEISKPPIPMGSHLRDDEHALYLLQQCGHNVDEALRRLRMNVTPNTETMSLWSEEECRNFESGIRMFGKNFHMIQQNKVRTRSVGELVQFYYLWKKSERHDIFANKTRLEKKKYTLHPGLTDFMDRFLEDQDGRDRSSSPNVQCNNTLDNKKSNDVSQESPSQSQHQIRSPSDT